MYSMNVVALALSLSVFVAARPSQPMKRFAAGRCGIHVTEAVSSKANLVSVTVKDNDGTQIGTGSDVGYIQCRAWKLADLIFSQSS
jgi:hypothetical protein